MKNRKKRAWAGAAMLGFILGIGGTNAYLTSYDQAVNVIGVGKNTTTIEEEFQDSVGRKWKRAGRKIPGRLLCESIHWVFQL